MTHFCFPHKFTNYRHIANGDIFTIISYLIIRGKNPYSVNAVDKVEVSYLTQLHSYLYFKVR